MALAVLVVTSSCTATKVVVAPADWQESVSHGERFMALPAHDCWEFYNVGKHTEWADCMGVGYK